MQKVHKGEKHFDTKRDMQFGHIRLMRFDGDIRALEEYRNGSLKSMSDTRAREIKVLDTLVNLGFSIKDVGTFFYRDMILKAMQYLDSGCDCFGNNISEEELLKQMQQPFSQFYLDVARYDLDVGIKTFHTYIEEALDKVDYRKADSCLLQNIYGDFSSTTDYGEHALMIGKYVNSTCEKGKKRYVKIIPIAAAMGL